MTRFWQVFVSVYGVGLADFVSLTPIVAQDVIEAAQLAASSRGIVFQTPYPSADEAVTVAGDVDGDGFDDLLFVKATDCPGRQPRRPVLMIYGRPDLTGTHPLSCEFPRSALFLTQSDLGSPGSRAFPAGDLNSDGRSDFFISLAPSEVRQVDSQVYLVFGDSGIEGQRFVEEVGDSLHGIVFYSSDPLEKNLGGAVANIGDFDGDGRDDIAFGCEGSTVKGREEAGRVYIVLRVMDSPRVDLTTVGKSLPGAQMEGSWYQPAPGEPVPEEPTGEDLGERITPVGDVDRDGYDDIIVQALGLQYLVRGTPSPRPLTDLLDLSNGVAIEGLTVFRRPKGTESIKASDLGDIDGDGYSDLLFAGPALHTPLFGRESVLHLLFGRQSWPHEIKLDDLGAEASTRYFEYEIGSGFGSSIAAAGDLNGDGIPDFLVGAIRASPGGLSEAGEAYAIFGRRGRPGEVKLDGGFDGVRLLGEAPMNRLGMEVASAGDFNGDGKLDFIVKPLKAPDPTGVDDLFVKFYLVHGTGGGPPPLRLHSLAPIWGPIRGGTVVEIRGTGFRGFVKVSFGGSPAESVEALSEFKMRAVTPAGTAIGLVDVEVTADGETRRHIDAFEYTPNFPDVSLSTLGPHGLILEGKWNDRLGERNKVTFGDLTGDGFDELVVAVSYSKGIKVAILKGAVDLPERLPAFTPSPRLTMVTKAENASEELRSVFVSALGDVNGDGFKDLGIARAEALGYVLFGGSELAEEIDLDDAVANGLAVQLVPRTTPTGNFTMVPLGDLSGDGIADFAVGFSQGLTDGGIRFQLEGEVLFVKGRTEWTAETDLRDERNLLSRIQGSRIGQALAKTVAAAGDINGDGFEDLLVDAGQGSGDVFMDHFAFVIFGSDRLPVEADIESHVAQGGGVKIQPPAPHLFGSPFNLFSLTGPGDLNGDGYADVVLGQGGGGVQYQGITYLIFGGPKLTGHVRVEERPAQEDGIVRIYGAASNRSASEVSGAGDFDADGFKDFLIGEKGYQDATGKAGNVYVILGREKFPEGIELARLGGHGIKIESRSPRWAVGPRVGSYGDLNGDGKSDFALGELYKLTGLDDVPPDDSRLYIIYGPTGSRRFIRGDANDDTVVDLSDAVSILSHLFLGGAAPCDRRPLDADDTGSLEITDAVYLLGYLFLGQPPPPAPFPSLGIDTTQDELGCRF